MKRIEQGARNAASRCRARAEQVPPEKRIYFHISFYLSTLLHYPLSPFPLQVQVVIDRTKEYEMANDRLASLRIMLGKEEPKKGGCKGGATLCSLVTSTAE